MRDSSRASQPGAQHKKLASLAGDWDLRLMSVEPDQSENELARGTAHLAWLLEGRFLRWEETLDIAGSTTGFLGYDARHGEYELLMISGLSTGMGVGRGTGDLSTGGIAFTLEDFDRQSGQRLRMSSRLRSIAPDHFLLDFLGQDPSGDERVMLRRHYRRALAADRQPPAEAVKR